MRASHAVIDNEMPKVLESVLVLEFFLRQVSQIRRNFKNYPTLKTRIFSEYHFNIMCTYKVSHIFRKMKGSLKFLFSKLSYC